MLEFCCFGCIDTVDGRRRGGGRGGGRVRVVVAGQHRNRRAEAKVVACIARGPRVQREDREKNAIYKPLISVWCVQNNVGKAISNVICVYHHRHQVCVCLMYILFVCLPVSVFSSITYSASKITRSIQRSRPNSADNYKGKNN